MTPAEQLVGRRCPALPKNFDNYLSRYVKNDGTFCGKLTPADSWLRPAHRKARQQGLVVFSQVSFGKGAELWFLTEKGEAAAREAKARFDQAMADRAQWGRDFQAAHARRSV